jgi:Domain of unknown function (DUF5658)
MFALNCWNVPKVAPMMHARTYERRHLPDRRQQPTLLRSALRLRGRRQGFRRAGEGFCAYVDCVTPRVVGLVTCVLVCSVLDACFTILHVQHGGQETNPLMALTLAYGYTPFVGMKMVLTGAGAWFLAAHQQFPLALKALYGLPCLYLALLVYHLLLFHSFAW